MCDGTLRFFYSIDIGGGYVRLPVQPNAKADFSKEPPEPIAGQSILKTDTRPVGMLLFGGSDGLLWNLSRTFAFTAEARMLTGLPHLGLVFEGMLSVQIAFFGESTISVEVSREKTYFCECCGSSECVERTHNNHPEKAKLCSRCPDRIYLCPTEETDDENEE